MTPDPIFDFPPEVAAKALAFVGTVICAATLAFHLIHRAI